MSTVCGMAILVAALAGCSAESSTSDGDASGVTPEVPADAPAGEAEGIARPAPPEWFGEREELPSCGLDEEYTPDYPNLDARQSFQDAYQAGMPAELGVVTYGDEGESVLRNFRVLEAGSYEVFEEQRPNPDPPPGGVATGSWAWVQYACTSITFLAEPGFEVDGLPILNNEGECRTVRVDEGTR